MQAQNILVIDDEDSGISYNKSELTSSCEYTPEFDELYKLFKEERDYIFWVNSKKCVRLVDGSGKEYSMHEYKAGMDLRFFKITDPELEKRNCEFFISADIDAYNNNDDIRAWSLSDFQYLNDLPIGERSSMAYDVVKEMIDGYDLCQKIMSAADYEINQEIENNPYGYRFTMADGIAMLNKPFNNPDAIVGCWKKKIICKPDNSDNNSNIEYHGFLPSAYQLMTLFRYMPFIEYFFIKKSEIDGIEHDYTKHFMKYGKFWSSNEYAGNFAIMVTRHEYIPIKEGIVSKSDMKGKFYNTVTAYKQIIN